MEKQNMYPDMPEAPMADNPPSYNQSFPTAPNMTSSGPQPMPAPASPYHQQQPVGYGQQPQQVLVQTGLPPPIPPLGPNPCMVTCPSCHQQQMTNILYENSTKTHLFALALCVVGLCCCACIPYCSDSCKNVNHYCKNCNAYLGNYNK